MIFGALPEHPYGAPSPSTRPAAMAVGGELATAASTIPILCLLPSDGEQHAHPSDQRLRFKSGQSTIIFIRRSSIQTHHAQLATASTLLADSHLIPTARFHLPQRPFRPSQQATVQRLTPKSPSSSHFPHPTLSSINGPLIQPRSSHPTHLLLQPTSIKHPDLDGDTSLWPTIPSASVLHSIFSTVGDIAPASVHHHHGRSPFRPISPPETDLQ
ncbi:hypothetical protein ACLOJK_005242 [Asimina triloba]